MSQSYETLLVERRGRVAVITINRPKKRTRSTSRRAPRARPRWTSCAKTTSVGVVVFTGAGDKAFVAGADIAEFAGRTAVTQRDVMIGRSLFTAIDTFPKPVIAMVNGLLPRRRLRAGALACDLRIASETASFGQPEINLGIIPGGGGTQRLTRLVGEGKAMELILTGDIIDAQTAFNLGLVNMVVPAADLEAKTMEMANRIAEKSPIALRMAKEAVKLRLALEPRRRACAARSISSRSASQARTRTRASRAFLEKRKPAFKGK